MHRTRTATVSLLLGGGLALFGPPARAAEPGARIKVNVVAAPLKRQWERVAQAIYGEVPGVADSMRLSMRNKPGLEVDEKSPEVVVTLASLEQREGQRGTDPYGAPTLQHLYFGRGTIDVAGQHLPLEVQREFIESKGNPKLDLLEYGKVGDDLAEKAADIISEHLDALRPARSQSGLHHIDLKVTLVEPGSPAEKAGLQPKDRIRRIDTQKSGGKMADRIQTWWMEPAGTHVALEIERNKQRQTVELVLLPRSAWGQEVPAPPATK